MRLIRFLDRIFRRAAKTGVPAETARVVGQQYLMLKEQNPEASTREIFSTIVSARHAAQPYTPRQLERLESAVGTNSVSSFVVEILLVESDLSAWEIRGEPLQGLISVVNEELRALGLAP